MADIKKPILVLSTFPEGVSAKDTAECLVNEKLAACVNIIPGVQSIFRWQDKIDNSNENILIIKNIPLHIAFDIINMPSKIYFRIFSFQLRNNVNIGGNLAGYKFKNIKIEIINSKTNK